MIRRFKKMSQNSPNSHYIKSFINSTLKAIKRKMKNKKPQKKDIFKNIV